MNLAKILVRPQGYRQFIDGPLGERLELPGRDGQRLSDIDAELLNELQFSQGYLRAWVISDYGLASAYLLALEFGTPAGATQFLLRWSKTVDWLSHAVQFDPSIESGGRGWILHGHHGYVAFTRGTVVFIINSQSPSEDRSAVLAEEIARQQEQLLTA